MDSSWGTTDSHGLFMDYLLGTAMAGLAHTTWMFHTIKPNATKAAMHDVNHPVFTGSYRRGLAFTACACGFS